MKQYDLIKLLGDAFALGNVDELVTHMADNCKYFSEYANISFCSADKIAERMKYVYSQLDETNSYSYEIVKLDSITNFSDAEKQFVAEKKTSLCKYGMFLYQFSKAHPVAIVVAVINHKKEICNITLSRNKKLFDIEFYGEKIEKDSPYDKPDTVKPLTRHDRQVKELQRAFSGQHLEEKVYSDDEVYIWRKSDEFFKKWLDNNGYYVQETDILDDCIGYLCNRNGYEYAVYMYAYGKERTTQLDGEYCSKLKKHSYSKNRTILIVYLRVKRFMNGDEVAYDVYSYGDNENKNIELWRLGKVNGKPIIEYYPRKEMVDRTYELMYAFNRTSLDVYDNIICKSNPSFKGYDSQGITFNGAFYYNLQNLHKEYGDMKMGYVRYNDVVYSKVPYLDNYGFFGFIVNDENRITQVYTCPFDGRDRPVAEFIKTDIREKEDMYSYIPKLVKAEPMLPVMYERFALKLLFDNGECKKYVLPVDAENENDEVVKYCSHVFTDTIWNSAEMVDSVESKYREYPSRGQAIKFKNGFSLSVHFCYQNSREYLEPIICNDVVYEDDEIKINRLWKWKANLIHQDEETGIIKTLLKGVAFNFEGVSTYATLEDGRLTSLDFDYIDSFKEGLAVVGIQGRGYGYIDTSGKIVIPAIYENASEFNNGKAKVKKDGNWYFIDKSGNETAIESTFEKKYEEVGEFCEGLCKVSTLKLGFMDLAYHSDYEEIAGIWGYVDENGTEIISPQYIYANDFNDGIAIVCKGKWTRDEKWNNEHNSGRYWTEEELWGAIDKTGKEVIPCVFDEIKEFCDVTEVYMAHFGGWHNGKWGVIDKDGKWVVEPIFEDIGYEYKNGLFTFYAADKWSDLDVPLGIYDIEQQKVLFEPRFSEVNFMEDGNIKVDVYDESLNRNIEKIINRNGEELFPSVYSSIYTWKDPYEVVISDENGSRRGLIDKKGNVILPCKYDTTWNGIHYDKKLMVFERDKRQGLIDFDDNIVVPAIYLEIHGVNNPLLTVRDGDKDNYLEGLIKHNGDKVLEPKYKRISWCNNNYLLCSFDGECQVLKYVKKN
ncbi:MAG: WG repeat-containing protein [Clostridia bacterium]|nr:WG repeat-containing protein [Clostridia bacterium]